MNMRANASIFVALLVTATLGVYGLARAATTTVDLGTAGNFAILAGTEVTNVPSSVITGSVGLSPAAGSNYQGLTAAEVSGTIYDVNGTGPVGSVNNPSLLTIAKNDLVTAFGDAAGRAPVTVVPTELGGTTKTAGVYASNASTFEITAGAGALVLDGENDPDAVFIFQMSTEGTGLTVGPSSTVTLIRGAQACNVFWRVDTASIDTGATFRGNVLALNSISVATGANIEGRLLARDGAVTLDQDTITIARCAAAATTTNDVSTISNASLAAGVSRLPASGASSRDDYSVWNIAILSALLAASLMVVMNQRDAEGKQNM